ncbi:MAG: protein kinase domain-containing protein [Leptolyngbyaceae cyanobacterium]
MQAPLPIGHTLKNRYQLLKILGQGGFGCTFLAKDLNRFGELCVLKELVPPYRDAASLAKAKDLFYREAKILYGLNHPQIPQFSEQFEENQRFFLVQEYIPGQTLQQLLADRSKQGQPFQEAEVGQLLEQILPVLVYLHDRAIIHRDITPDNIILRQADRLPVLIDFGAVKAAITHRGSSAAPTIIGKLSYAAPEQMQSGTVYPSSDLYSLAVTVIVLLTGRSPVELYAPQHRTWNWQYWATVSPDLAAVLDRMLSDRPTDRYGSAKAVLAALRHPVALPAAATTSHQPTQAIGQPRRPLGMAPAPTSTPPLSEWDRWVTWLGKTSLVVLQSMGWGVRRVILPLLQWSFKLTLILLKWLFGLLPRWLILSVAIAAMLWAYQQVTGKPVISLPPSLPEWPSLPKFPPLGR